MEYELLEENKDSRRLPDRLGDSEGLLMSGKIHGEHPRCPDGYEFPIETNSFGDSIASDVFDASLLGHQRKMDPAFLCLTDDQKASSALCSDLYEEVVCQIHSIASVRKYSIRCWRRTVMLMITAAFAALGSPTGLETIFLIDVNIKLQAGPQL